MKKTILLVILGIVLVTTLIQAVSAYNDRYYYNYEPRYRYDYDGYSGYGYICASVDKYDCYGGRSGYPYRFSNNDITKRQAVRWIDNSFKARYQATSGMTSGQAFGGTNNPAQSSTSFRYKPAYDLRTDGTGNGKTYYYQPQYDSKLGHFNWDY